MRQRLLVLIAICLTTAVFASPNFSSVKFYVTNNSNRNLEGFTCLLDDNAPAVCEKKLTEHENGIISQHAPKQYIFSAHKIPECKLFFAGRQACYYDYDNNKYRMPAWFEMRGSTATVSITVKKNGKMTVKQG